MGLGSWVLCLTLPRLHRGDWYGSIWSIVNLDLAMRVLCLMAYRLGVTILVKGRFMALARLVFYRLGVPTHVMGRLTLRLCRGLCGFILSLDLASWVLCRKECIMLRLSILRLFTQE